MTKLWSLIFAGVFVAHSFYAFSEEMIVVSSVLDVTHNGEDGPILSAQVEYSGLCFEPQNQTALVESESGIIELYHQANRRTEDCGLGLQSEIIDFHLGQLPDGSYVVVDGISSNELAKFTIKKGEVFRN